MELMEKKKKTKKQGTRDPQKIGKYKKNGNTTSTRRYLCYACFVLVSVLVWMMFEFCVKKGTLSARASALTNASDLKGGN